MSKKRKGEPREASSSERPDKLTFEGAVEEALAGSMFKVNCDNGCTVLATLSGKLRLNKIRILPGDKVTVEVSAYDITRGRIVYRN